MATEKNEPASADKKKKPTKEDVLKKKESEARRTRKKSVSRNEDGSYNVEGDKAERSAAKDEAESKNRRISLRDDNDDDVDARPEWQQRLSEISWKQVAVSAGAFLLLGTMGGCAVGYAIAPSAPQATPTKKARSIEGIHSVLDDVETMKDDQILALRKQMGSIREKNSNERLTQEEAAALSRLNADVAELLDPFFDSVLGIKRDASGAELDSIRRQLADDVTSSGSTSMLYGFLNGASPAKQLNTQVSKSGPVLAMWSGSSSKNERTYVVSAPIVTEDATYKAQYLVSVEDNKIDNVEYTGLLLDTQTPLEKQLAEQLKGDPDKAGEGVASLTGKSKGSSSSSENSLSDDEDDPSSLGNRGLSDDASGESDDELASSQDGE